MPRPLACVTRRRAPADLVPALRRALLGCVDERWNPPSWLYPHQREAAQRLAAAVQIFRGAVLADQVGLGKTYVSLALATRYPRATAIVPAVLRSQWHRVARRLGVPVTVISHESLSRARTVDVAPFVIVDEAHRFRNPETRRYDRLARAVTASHLCLVTATPVVNGPRDLIHLVRLFLADHALAGRGVPSLEGALDAPDPPQLMHALAPLIVGRSAHVLPATFRLPALRDRPPVVASPVPEELLPPVVAALDALAFPSFDAAGAGLLRQHVFYRLASSTAALVETLQRHKAYLDDALAAAHRGERLTRRAARRLWGGDEQQLLLPPAHVHPRDFVAARHLEEERARLDRVLRFVRPISCSPKRDRLGQLLRGRGRARTIVFTTAASTAHSLARALRWERVALVASGRARLASGPIPVEEALRLFAPRARGAAAPARHLDVRVLIATDLASEGFDLQDADAVVHYDLPWTPLRLEQRLGRIARLRSPHDEVASWWFVPAPALERRLCLVDRIARKHIDQVRTAVVRTSRVGVTGVAGGFLEDRERALAGPRDDVLGYAVVEGPRRFIAALWWDTPGGPLGEIVVSDARHLGARELTELARGAEKDGPVPAWVRERLDAFVRERERLMDGGPVHAAARTLRRRVLSLARWAARRRRHRLVDALDRVLRQVHSGLPVGAERALADLLHREPRVKDLRQWLQDHPAPTHAWRAPTVRALIVMEPDCSLGNASL